MSDVFEDAINESIAAGEPVLPESIKKVLDAETFDVNDWLASTSYAEDSIEIFNSGPATYELLELQTQLQNAGTRRDEREKQRKLNGVLGALTDEEPDYEAEEIVLVAARARVLEIRSELKGTGTTWYFRGLAPVERDLIGKQIARALKPRKAKFEDNEDGESVEVEPATPGGKDHPDYNVKFENELIARSLQKIVGANGATSKTKPDAVGIMAFREKLHISEFRRLASCAFDVNYFSYDIDNLITVDF